MTEGAGGFGAVAARVAQRPGQDDSAVPARAYLEGGMRTAAMRHPHALPDALGVAGSGTGLGGIHLRHDRHGVEVFRDVTTSDQVGQLLKGWYTRRHCQHAPTMSHITPAMLPNGRPPRARPIAESTGHISEGGCRQFPLVEATPRTQWECLGHTS